MENKNKLINFQINIIVNFLAIAVAKLTATALQKFYVRKNIMFIWLKANFSQKTQDWLGNYDFLPTEEIKLPSRIMHL